MPAVTSHAHSDILCPHDRRDPLMGVGRVGRVGSVGRAPVAGVPEGRGAGGRRGCRGARAPTKLKHAKARTWQDFGIKA